MADRFVFADEAGNFDFSRNRGASRYFILTTLTCDDPGVGGALLRLRHQLLAEGVSKPRPEFHATEDTQAVRDRVFAELAGHSFRVDATILEKCKAQPRIRTSEAKFYQYAWYYHMKHVAPAVARSADTLVVVGASLGVKKKQAAFRSAMEDVMRQVSPTSKTRIAFWESRCDPCLQVADYCCWAIQRKWERGDDRSHSLIKNAIISEYDLWSGGSVNYY